MATHKSAEKRSRQSIKKHARNVSYRSLLKSTTKKVLAEIETKDKKKAQDSIKEATRVISQIASKGVIHKRAAARKISGLARKAHQLASV